MTKTRKTIVFILMFLILLTACQTAPVTESTAASSSVLPSSPPAGSSVPPTSTPASSAVLPTTVPETSAPVVDEIDPQVFEGFGLIYKGVNPYTGIEPDLSECVLGNLYWIEKSTEMVYAVCEEEVVRFVSTDTNLYFVKADDQTKIYATYLENPTQYELIYECSHGTVTNMTIDTFYIQKQLVLQLVVDNKKFVVVNLETEEDFLLMQQHYIKMAWLQDDATDTWEEQNIIYFEGQPTPDAQDWDYLYYRDTGTVELENSFNDD